LEKIAHRRSLTDEKRFEPLDPALRLLTVAIPKAYRPATLPNSLSVPSVKTILLENVTRRVPLLVALFLKKFNGNM
jgi:hypothetical protein